MILQFFYDHFYLIGIVALLISLMGMPVVLKVAHRFGLVVHPNKRTSHTGDIPDVGGVDICMGFLITFLLFVYPITRQTQFLLVGAVLMMCVGFVDDIFVLKPSHKTIGEMTAAVFLILFARCLVTNLGGIVDIREIGLVGGSILSFIVLFAIVNAVNLIDGVDGLASGLGILFFTFFTIYFYRAGQMMWAILSYIVIGSLIIFFCYNVFGRTKRKIFMGDSGSLLLGYLITACVFQFCQMNTYGLLSNPALIFHCPHGTCICILAIPVFDACRLFISRMRHHKSPFAPDKNHIHHLLLVLGLTHLQTTTIILIVELFFIGLAVWSRQWNFILIIVCCCILYGTFIGVVKFLGKRKARREASN